ncbi:hypothetical protein L1987_84003 [Smallanthus sonchifolius]|uniref:Uncharacterized protein n=1 Tax=Smallanthus sonchifolius TaxID=185202 RepID=A0ACB8YDQ6_9ASTR|nr:hypothetical protein L1987_84003 [Smallanthus sonchifolius]
METTKKVKDETEEKDGSLLYQIPMNRVSRIVKSEDPITQEAVYIINKASEKFLQMFTTEAYASAFLDRKKHIDYKHLWKFCAFGTMNVEGYYVANSVIFVVESASIVTKRRRFDFLTDFVPEKLKAEDALTESQPVEN